ncbi:MAG: nuclease-related domain-containing protein [Trichodesmium sp. MO_231.B1]|nr:nuclease-related domain-containing protein [Trichodesmium sp. MO_231.B1]
MTIEVWMGKNFDTSYEREAVGKFLDDMEFRFGNEEKLHLVLMDYYIENRQIDLTVLKNDAIIPIELKECHEPFLASENGDWCTPSGYIVGSEDRNPFQQVYEHRIKWFNLLKANKHKFRCLDNAPDGRPFWYSTCIVAISPSLHPNITNKISSDSWWFRLFGLDELAKQIEFQTNKYMNFSDDELRKIASDLLSLKQKSHQARKNTKEWENKLKEREERLEKRELEIKQKEKELAKREEFLGYQEAALKKWADELQKGKESL